MEQKGMTYAVVGYLRDDVAKSLGTKGYGNALELRIERGSDQQIVRIKPEDVAGVLHGAASGGETSVQVLLKDNATVETVSRGAISDFLRPISDKSLFVQRPPYNVIFIDPLQIRQLTELTAQPAHAQQK